MSAPAMLDYFTLVRVLKLVEASSDKEQMQMGTNDARSDDVKRITSFVGTWLNEDRDRPELRVLTILATQRLPTPTARLS
jgi:hypothetical protein